MTAPSVLPIRLSGHGFAIDLPPRWEGRIYQRPTPSQEPAGSGAGQRVFAGETVHPVLHLANFALPAVRGDYGSGAVESMGPGAIFIALVEFGADCLDTALFAARALPRPEAARFSPNALQRRLPGQAGFQSFGTVGRRPIALYVVLGSRRDTPSMAARANAILDRVEVSPR